MKQVGLRAARERAGIQTQTELAERSGVDISTISRIEAGKNSNPSIETVIRLEQALKLKRGTLVFGEAADQVMAERAS